MWRNTWLQLNLITYMYISITNPHSFLHCCNICNAMGIFYYMHSELLTETLFSKIRYALHH
jgi:hypothetical protein